MSVFSMDHPRVGGEKARPAAAAANNGGSPPRGRGKVEGATVQACHLRITPAWAGKRRLYPASGCQNGDHPRVGGEKLAAA